MTLEQMFNLLAVISAAYPKMEFTTPQVKIWHEMFQDVDFRTAQVAVKKLIVENTFPPSIAEVRKSISEISATDSERLTAADAWGEVMKAVRHYGSYGEVKAFEIFSPLTAQVVRYIGYKEICLSENIGVVRGQFLKMFEQVAKRDREDRLLPGPLKEEIKMLAEKMDLRLIQGGK